MGKKNIRISENEWTIMKVLWNKSPAKAGEIINELSSKDWNHRTIRTMLSRLVKKGALNFEQNGNIYIYTPAISMEECIREESRSFINRVFDGATTPMLAHFVKNTELTKEDIRELKAILRDKEE